MFDLPDQPLQTITDVLLLPMIILFFGASVYAAGYFRGIQSRSLPRFRWVGLILIGFAAVLGFRSFWWLQDHAYINAVPGKRVLYAHYLGFFFPVLCIIAAIVMELLYKRKGREWE